MGKTQNQTLVYKKMPTGPVVPGEHLKRETGEIDLDAPLGPGAILLKTAALSLDPYLRGRMRDPKIQSYIPAFDLGEPLVNFGIGRVLKSNNPAFAVGADVYGPLAFAEYSVVPAPEEAKLMVVKNEEGLPLSYYVGAAGMPGQTAWFGLNSVPIKAGETIFVSGASGAVGQVVIGLAKERGLKVIAAAGSDEKVEFLRKTLGVDHAFNYKTTDQAAFLAEHPFHLFWDNVGGATLDAVLATIQPKGRIIACGAIHGYETGFDPVKNWMFIVGKSLTVRGILILGEDVKPFYAEVPALIRDGRIKVKEHVTRGLDNGEAFTELFTGANFGKSVIVFE